MSDEDLSNFIPKYGDRVAVKEFCLKKNSPNTRKQSLLDKLRKKMRKSRKPSRSSSEDEKIETHNKKLKIGNSKDTRQIEVGWLCSTNGDRYVHIRTKQGGGTRKISVPKTATKDFIQQRALELFFPENVSSKGHISKFTVQLWDFKSNIINEEFNIEEMFVLSGLTRLRFYLATKEKCCTITSCSVTEDNTNPIPSSSSTPTSASTSMETDLQNSSQVLYANDFYTQLINDTILFDYTASNSIPPDEMTNPEQFPVIVLHRGQVFDELIDSFYGVDKNCGSLNIKMLLPNGEPEMGIDFGGVLRDALSEFWSTFYSKCTVGTTAKIPYIRHDFDLRKWNAIAKILYYGWNHVKYFPIEISSIFFEHCVTGGIKSDILNHFFEYLSKNETETLKTALDSFDTVDREELLEVMGNLDCKLLLNKDNIRKVLTDIAHKKMIQKPMFVIDSWHSVLSGMLTASEITEIYTKSQVTPKNVLSLLSHNDTLTSNEGKIFGYLKKFIRETDVVHLKSFLRFCTGADVITNNKITVNFVEKEGLSRIPVAHTCGCILNLPLNYDSFPEFRSEFETLLSSNIWVMDFV